MKKYYFLCLMGIMMIFLASCTTVVKSNDSAEGTGNDLSSQQILMMKDIQENAIVGDGEPIELKEVEEIAGYEIIIPEDLPADFKYYGTFVKDFGELFGKSVRHLWYNQEKLEVYMVTQFQTLGESDSEEEIIFTNEFDGSQKVEDLFPWAKNAIIYEFIEDEVYIQVLMLVNIEENNETYEKLIKSIKKNK